MTTRYLGPLEIPSDSQTESQSQHRQRLAKQGLLEGSTGNVQSISSEPGEFTLSGQYRGRLAEKLATEMEEMFDAGSTLGPVPFYGVEGMPRDGYYSLENVDLHRADPRTDAVQVFDGRLAHEGTREDKRRVVETPKDGIAQVENDFGNAQTAYVGVPAAANDVQWYDSESEQTEAATVVETRVGEHGDVDVVDALAASFDGPSLVYDIAYDQEWQTDCHVFDTKGGAKTDTDGILQWTRVFRGGHDFEGVPVVTNRLVRVWFGSGLAVEEYDSTTSSWTSVALGTSDWELDAWDVTHIGLPRVGVQCRFRNPVAGETFYLDMSLNRGWERPLWIVPENETPPTPSGLVDLLGPVASESDYDPQAEQGLVNRSEVRA